MFANFVIGAENITNTDAQGHQVQGIIAPTVQFSLPSFPTNYTFATNILIGQIDLTKENTMLAKIFNKNDETDIVLEIETNVPVSTDKGDTEVSLSFAGEARNAFFRTEGEYRCVVYINNELLCDTPLYITKEIKED